MNRLAMAVYLVPMAKWHLNKCDILINWKVTSSRKNMGDGDSPWITATSTFY